MIYVSSQKNIPGHCLSSFSLLQVASVRFALITSTLVYIDWELPASERILYMRLTDLQVTIALFIASSLTISSQA